MREKGTNDEHDATMPQLRGQPDALPGLCEVLLLRLDGRAEPIPGAAMMREEGGMVRRWFLIELGCAECGDMPLALPRGLHDSERAAQEASLALTNGREQRWLPHPNGGSFAQWGSGGLWCAPLASLGNDGTEFGDEYDDEYDDEYR